MATVALTSRCSPASRTPEANGLKPPAAFVLEVLQAEGGVNPAGRDWNDMRGGGMIQTLGVDGNKTRGISDTIRITERSCASFFDFPEDFVLKPELKAVPKPEQDAC